MIPNSENFSGTHFIAHGNGSPVILIHGIAASLHDWIHLVPALTEAGYRSYALDLLGHGDSSKPVEPGQYHFQYLYTQLTEWIATLQLMQPPILIGHSLGGFLCLNYALDHPDCVQRLVLAAPLYQYNQISPWLRIINRRPAIIARSVRLAPVWLVHTLAGWEINPRMTFSSPIRHQKAVDYKRASPHFLHIPRTVPDLTTQLPHLTTKTLVVWGENDLTLKPASFPRLVKILPNARGYAIPHCGHQPHLGMYVLFNRLVLDFFNEI